MTCQSSKEAVPAEKDRSSSRQDPRWKPTADQSSCKPLSQITLWTRPGRKQIWDMRTFQSERRCSSSSLYSFSTRISRGAVACFSREAAPSSSREKHFCTDATDALPTGLISQHRVHSTPAIRGVHDADKSRLKAATNSSLRRLRLLTRMKNPFCQGNSRVENKAAAISGIMLVLHVFANIPPHQFVLYIPRPLFFFFPAQTSTSCSPCRDVKNGRSSLSHYFSFSIRSFLIIIANEGLRAKRQITSYLIAYELSLH